MTTARPRVRADVFPAVVAVAPPNDPTPASLSLKLSSHPDHRRVERTRVVLTLDTVLIFQDSSEGPRLIFSDTYAPDSYTPPPSARTLTIRTRHLAAREATLTTTSGKTLAFNRMQGCGCGSRLRALDPFSPTHASTPLAASTLDS